MTMLQLFRLWVRRSPLGERVSAGVGAAMALALLIWLVSPDSASGVAGKLDAASLQTGAANGGAANGSVAGPTGAASVSGPTGVTTGPAVVGGSTAGASATTTGLQTTTNAAGCKAPGGSDQGVTASTIKVAVIVLSIAGPVGNSTYGVDTPAVQQQHFQTVVNHINATGGVACRKLVAQYFSGNPADSSQLQQVCLDVAAAHPFFLFEGGAYGFIYPSLAQCFIDNRIPFLSPTYSTASTIAKWYPYAFFAGQRNIAYHNMIFALKQRGWFSPSNGFKKLGFAYQNCDSQIPNQFIDWLHQAGIQDSQISAFDLGCSALFSPPSVISQAILQFQQAGVTNVTFANDGNDWAPFTKIAEQQQFKPKYGITDDEAQVAVTYSNNAPDHNNIAGTIDIDDGATGEEHTPGMSPSAMTQQCLGLFGYKVTYPVPDYSTMEKEGSYGGDCSVVWQFKEMVDHAPVLQRTALAAGLQNAKTVPYAYGVGPGNFSVARTMWGGQFWRVNEFQPACDCFRLIDKTFHPIL